MPQKGGKSEHEKTKKHEVVDMTQMEPRSKRQSTAEATARSAERNQNDKVRRGIAENSNKRRALTASMDEAQIPMSDIFGEDRKKPWKQHPKYHQLEEKAAAYVDKLPYSQPKGGGETMHSLARKLTVTIPTSKTPAKPVLTHAIVVAKLRHLDTSACLSYE